MRLVNKGNNLKIYEIEIHSIWRSLDAWNYTVGNLMKCFGVIPRIFLRLTGLNITKIQYYGTSNTAARVFQIFCQKQKSEFFIQKMDKEKSRFACIIEILLEILLKT